jgi:hypothetical protein
MQRSYTNTKLEKSPIVVVELRKKEMVYTCCWLELPVKK